MNRGRLRTTRRVEAGLWLTHGCEVATHRFLTHAEKRIEVERALLRVKELVRAELEECLRIAP